MAWLEAQAGGLVCAVAVVKMRLGQKQRLFARLYAKLILHAFELGFEVTLGEVVRGEQQAQYNSLHCRCCKQAQAAHPRAECPGKFRAIGIYDTLHRKRLAGDLNLFTNGHYLTSTDAHRPLGEWWETQHELCRWGGRFGDGNHYSIAHAGKR